MKGTLHRLLAMKDGTLNPINGPRQPKMLNMGVNEAIEQMVIAV
jgi:hypothetical protein